MSVDSPECVTVLKRSPFWNPHTALHAIRGHSNELLAQHLRPEQAELASAFLLGIREQVDSQRIEMYMTTGTVHLLSISGLHVGVLASGFWLIARLGWLPRRTTLFFAIGLFIFYAMFTDAQPPVVRAAVLISVDVCGQTARSTRIRVQYAGVGRFDTARRKPNELVPDGNATLFSGSRDVVMLPTNFVLVERAGRSIATVDFAEPSVADTHAEEFRCLCMAVVGDFNRDLACGGAAGDVPIPLGFADRDLLEPCRVGADERGDVLGVRCVDPWLDRAAARGRVRVGV